MRIQTKALWLWLLQMLCYQNNLQFLNRPSLQGDVKQQRKEAQTCSGHRTSGQRFGWNILSLIRWHRRNSSILTVLIYRWTLNVCSSPHGRSSAGGLWSAALSILYPGPRIPFYKLKRGPKLVHLNRTWDIVDLVKSRGFSWVFSCISAGSETWLGVRRWTSCLDSVTISKSSWLNYSGSSTDVHEHAQMW